MKDSRAVWTSPNFRAAWCEYLRYEVGGLSNGGLHTDPDDPGGTTKYGIAQRYHPKIDVARINEVQAQYLIFQGYWRPHRLHELKHRRVATLMLLAITNMNQRDASKALQRACWVTAVTLRRLPRARLVEDGRIGPATIAEANRLRGKPLAASLASELQGEYLKRIALRPVNAKYGRGWRARAISEYELTA